MGLSDYVVTAKVKDYLKPFNIWSHYNKINDHFHLCASANLGTVCISVETNWTHMELIHDIAQGIRPVCLTEPIHGYDFEKPPR